MPQLASLYFHIPFCSKKCPYCHFYVLPNRAKDQALLREGLALEWALQAPLLEGVEIASIYFGGGTPTLFGAEGLGEALARCRALPWAPGCEVTVEANPEESSVELFAALKGVGVNRISLGVQSLDDRSLAVLERQHSAKKAKEAIEAVRQAGIDNVSIDLMYDLPSQTEASWRYTLDQLPSLPIQHLSLYNLTIEPHTSFHKRKKSLVFPTADESLRLLHLGLDALQKTGLERYEISAFAKPGFTSRHNVGYWTFRPFLGFGPSAFSHWGGERFQNICHLGRYSEALRAGRSPVDYRERLPYPANLKEQLAVQLRLKRGVELPDQLPEETKRAIASLQEQGFVEKQSSLLRLTERGMLFYDTVATELI